MATFSPKIKKTISKTFVDENKQAVMETRILNEDNMSAIYSMNKIDAVDGRTSHIQRNQNYIKFCIADKELRFVHCSGTEEFADIFTKTLRPDLFWRFNSEFVQSREAVKDSSHVLSLIPLTGSLMQPTA